MCLYLAEFRNNVVKTPLSDSSCNKVLPPHFKTWFVTQLAMFDTVCMYINLYIYILTNIFTFTPSVRLVKKQLSFLWGPLCSFLQMADSKQWLLQSRGGLISRKVTSFVQGRRKSQRRESTRRSFGRWAKNRKRSSMSFCSLVGPSFGLVDWWSKDVQRTHLGAQAAKVGIFRQCVIPEMPIPLSHISGWVETLRWSCLVTIHFWGTLR